VRYSNVVAVSGTIAQVEKTLDIHGTPPELAGQRCDELLCQQYWYGGSLESPANVVFLHVSSRWHRLTFDYGNIFWSIERERPAAEALPEIEAEYRIDDLGRHLAVNGLLIQSYDTRPTLEGAEVEFHFEGGRSVTFRDTGEQTVFIA
jgi:hypothetical protein